MCCICWAALGQTLLGVGVESVIRTVSWNVLRCVLELQRLVSFHLYLGHLADYCPKVLTESTFVRRNRVRMSVEQVSGTHNKEELTNRLVH